MKKTYLFLVWVVLFLVVLYGSGMPQAFALPTWSFYAGNPVIPLGAGGTWDAVHTHNPSVLYVSGTYYMYFNGAKMVGGDESSQIGLATSTDGLTWTPNGGNPITGLQVPTGGYDVYLPTVIKDGSVWKMWYTYNGYTEGKNRIFYATSNNGLAWTIQNSGAPVLPLGGAGSDDEYGGWAPCVIKEGSTYYMWYSGSTSAYLYQVIYATSSDGITWTKQNSGHTIFPIAGSETATSDSQVVLLGSTYYMFYDDSVDLPQERVATSTDKINWTRDTTHGEFLGLGTGSSWDSVLRYGAVPIIDPTNSGGYPLLHRAIQLAFTNW